MERFTVLDISGDIGLTALGDSLQEAFVNAAIGMYSLMTGLDAVATKKTIDMSVEHQSPEGLLVSWLNELIFHFDAYGFIGKKIDIKEFSEKRISASIAGEEFDPERHEGRLLIKAATYHRLRIEKKNERWEISVIFDI
ncbi:MAG: archease [Nitrospirales bacterium]|jgi:SHS2 domain-containing protein|nr:MAG: archease [Nitrospirales bacterium]